jgi:hypothetical protein
MADDRTEAQHYAAAILVTLECALHDLYPGRVSSGGTLWMRQIRFWLNDLQEMLVDYSSDIGIRVRIMSYDVDEPDEDEDSSGDGGGDSVVPGVLFSLPLNADEFTILEFSKNIIIEVAESVTIDPRMLVQKIFEVSQNAQRLQQAVAGTGAAAPEPADIFQPG